MSSRLIVGIDGGGTKTRAAAYLVEGGKKTLGEALGVADAGPSNIAALPVDEAVANVLRAVAGAGCDPADADAVCAAVAGYSFASRRREFERQIAAAFPKARVKVAHDYASAFRAAFPDGRGILVIAGTGSNAYGADAASGRSHNAGGTGYLIDDSGSGYGVGREALAAVFGAIDGSGEATALSETVPSALGLAAEDLWDEVIEGVYGGAIERVTIAGLAQVVSAAADQGDEVSSRILMRAGGALARIAEAVHRRVFASSNGPAVRIARVGSLWNAGESLTAVFERSCRRFSPGCEFIAEAGDPVRGAVLIALDLLETAAG